jgi:hypothetical protein
MKNSVFISLKGLGLLRFHYVLEYIKFVFIVIYKMCVSILKLSPFCKFADIGEHNDKTVFLFR